MPPKDGWHVCAPLKDSVWCASYVCACIVELLIFAVHYFLFVTFLSLFLQCTITLVWFKIHCSAPLCWAVGYSRHFLLVYLWPVLVLVKKSTIMMSLFSVLFFILEVLGFHTCSFALLNLLEVSVVLMVLIVFFSSFWWHWKCDTLSELPFSGEIMKVARYSLHLGIDLLMFSFVVDLACWPYFALASTFCL